MTLTALRHRLWMKHHWSDRLGGSSSLVRAKLPRELRCWVTWLWTTELRTGGKDARWVRGMPTGSGVGCPGGPRTPSRGGVAWEGGASSSSVNRITCVGGGGGAESALGVGGGDSDGGGGPPGGGGLTSWEAVAWGTTSGGARECAYTSLRLSTRCLSKARSEESRTALSNRI